MLLKVAEVRSNIGSNYIGREPITLGSRKVEGGINDLIFIDWQKFRESMQGSTIRNVV